MKKTSHMIWIAEVYLRNKEKHVVEVVEIITQLPVSIDVFLAAVNSQAEEKVKNLNLDNYYVASINLDPNHERIVINDEVKDADRIEQDKESL